MPNAVPFVYREVYDVPRFMVVTYRQQHFLFESAFDELLDDYPDVYQVFLMPGLSEETLRGSWEYLSEKALSYLGAVPVKDIVFDETKRREIETGVLEKLLANASRELAGAARP